MNYDLHPLGYHVPVYRSLVEPILLGGVPRSIAILIGTLCAAIGLGLQQWIAGLFLFVVGQAMAALATRHDPDFLLCLLRHLRHRGYLSC